VSAAWTVAVVVMASAALLGISMFMVRVHRGDWWDDAGRSPRSTPASPPSVTAPPRAPERPPFSPRPRNGEVGAHAVAPAGAVTADTVVATLRGRALAVPVRGTSAASLTPSFTQARGTRVHEALDVMAPSGTPVVAVEDGTVEKLFRSDAGGLTIYQFDPSRSVAYYYAHLQGYAEGLADGAPVSRGQVIGYVGTTGNARPDAPHLHFAIFLLGPEKKWWDGEAIDPYLVLR